ncbi:MAG: hypothetical protein OXR67_00550 [Chloroflexota bacterium]|nr:hypothetical protein [Chloroflexota bacterium]
MTTEGRQHIDGALSPVPTELCPGGLERWREEYGLTWRKLAASASIAGRDAAPPLRRVERLQPGLGHQGIVVLARDLPGGCGLSACGNDACDQNGNRHRDGHGG